MIGAILAGIGLLVGAALVVFFLHEGGVVERERDYDGPIEGWWGQPMGENE